MSDILVLSTTLGWVQLLVSCGSLYLVIIQVYTNDGKIARAILIYQYVLY